MKKVKDPLDVISKFIGTENNLAQPMENKAVIFIVDILSEKVQDIIYTDCDFLYIFYGLEYDPETQVEYSNEIGIALLINELLLKKDYSLCHNFPVPNPQYQQTQLVAYVTAVYQPVATSNIYQIADTLNNMYQVESNFCTPKVTFKPSRYSI